MVDVNGWNYEFKYVDVNFLFEDPTYQRQKTQARVMKMANDYVMNLVGALIVNDRGNNRYAIMDGGTRFQAARLRNRLTDSSLINSLPCLVFKGLSVEEEARYFDYYNTWTVPVTGVDKFRARVASGDETAAEVNQLIVDKGYQIADPNQPNFMKSTSQLEKIYSTFGAEAAKVALEASTFWPLNQDAISGPFLLSIARLYVSEQEREKVLPSLRDLAKITQATELLKNAREQRRGTNKAGVNTAHYLTEILRKSVRGSSRGN